MFALIADINFKSMSFGEILRAVVIVAALVAIVVVALRAFEIEIPGWLVKIFWIVVIAVVAIGAIHLILNL